MAPHGHRRQQTGNGDQQSNFSHETQTRLLWNPTLESPIAKLFKSPGNRSPVGARYFGGIRVDKLWNKLQVLIIQQVLRAKRELQVCNRLPANVSIQGVVARNIEARKPIHVTKSQVLFQMLRQVQ